jgi:hypothetical protein
MSAPPGLLGDLAYFFDSLPFDDPLAQRLSAVGPVGKPRELPSAESMALIDRYGIEDPTEPRVLAKWLLTIEVEKTVESSH